MKTKKVLCLALAAVLSLSVVGCGKKPEEPITPNEGTTERVMAADQTFTYVTNSDIQTMDPALASSIPNWAGAAPVYENLVTVRTTPDNITEIVPGVAKTWDISPDGLVYTFHLRDNAKWSDGVAVTANDFVYTWRRTFDPKVASSYAWMVQGIIKNSNAVMTGEKPLEELGVKAIDELTFEMTLEKPSQFMLIFAGFPTYYPVRQDVIEKYGAEYGSSAEKVVGNGPFTMAKWEPTASITYAKSETYWDKDNVFLTTVKRQIITETNAVAQSLIANEVDSAGINKPEWNQIIDDTGVYNVTTMARPEIENFLFNCGDKVLSNQKIRLAISLAYDREKHNTEIMEGNSVPLYSIVPPSLSIGALNYQEAVKGENEYLKELLSKNDPKALLIEGMKELGLGEDPSKLEIHYMTRGTSEWSKKDAEWLKQQLETVLGIKVIIDLTEWNIMYDLIDAGTYQIAQGGWAADYDDPSNFLDNYHYKTGSYGEAKLHWNDDKAKEYAKLIDDAKAATDDQERANLYKDAEKILLEEAPVSPQYAPKLRTLIGKYVEGYYVNPLVYPNFVGVKMMEKDKK